jgi:hypothetical protein
MMETIESEGYHDGKRESAIHLLINSRAYFDWRFRKALEACDGC